MICSLLASNSRLFARTHRKVEPNSQEPQARRFAAVSSLLSSGGLLGAALAVIVLGVPLSPAHSDVFYETGFEQPTFISGPIVGQGGWTIPEGGGPAGSISAAFPKAGGQSLRIDPNKGGATSFQYQPGGANPIYEGEGRVVSVKVEAALVGPSTGEDLISVNLQPDLYFVDPDLGGFAVQTSPIWLSSDGHIHFITGHVFPAQYVTGPLALFGQYNEIEARFDFPDQKTIYFFNGDEIGEDSWTDFGVTFTEFSTPELQLVALQPRDTYSPENYQGYFDNLEISSISSVPEPSSLTLLAIGFLGVIVCGSWRRLFRQTMLQAVAG